MSWKMSDQGVWFSQHAAMASRVQKRCWRGCGVVVPSNPSRAPLLESSEPGGLLGKKKVCAGFWAGWVVALGLGLGRDTGAKQE